MPGFDFAQYKANGQSILARYIGFESNPDENATTMFGIRGTSVPVNNTQIVVETVYLPSEVQAGALVEAAEAAGKHSLNIANYKGFPKGTLKLVDLQSNQRGSDESDEQNNIQLWEVTYAFDFAPPKTISRNGLPAFKDENNQAHAGGDVFDGHAFVDSLFVEDEVQIANDIYITVPRLVRIAVHDLFPYISFADVLEI